MKIHLLSGFLGSGKTTAIQQAVSSLLQKNNSVGVITNDQGIRLVDGGFFKSLGVPSRQVINGCFCCNYQELENNIQSLVETNNTEIIFAESVGSCTDVVATVLKPLRQFRTAATVTLSTFADVRLLQMILNGNHSFDKTVEYIYLKQLEEAAVMVINKIDLVTVEELQKLKMLMQEKYGTKTLLYQNSLSYESVQQWLHLLNQEDSTLSTPLSSLDINYDTYAAGEASLAWLDQSLEIFGDHNNAWQDAQEFINLLYKKINDHSYSIGHCKFLIDDAVKISFTNANEPAVVLPTVASSVVSMLVNIRIQATPGAIQEMVVSSIKEVECKSGCKILVNSIDAFQPGYPKPQRRM